MEALDNIITYHKGWPILEWVIKVSKSRKQIKMSLIFPKKNNETHLGYYPEGVLFVFWKNPGLHNLLSRLSDL